MTKMRIQAFAGLHEYVAEKNGYFQQEGLDYEIVRNAGGMQRMTEAPTAPLTEAQRAAAPDRPEGRQAELYRGTFRPHRPDVRPKDPGREHVGHREGHPRVARLSQDRRHHLHAGLLDHGRRPRHRPARALLSRSRARADGDR